MGDVTGLLSDFQDGDADAFKRVVELLYSDLEKMTAAEMKRQFGGRLDIVTWLPGEALSEAVIRLCKERCAAANRKEFFAGAAKLIGEVVVDYQRKRLAAKRGGRAGRGQPLHDGLADHAAPTPDQQLTEFGELLAMLIREKPLHAEVLTLRVIAGYSRPQIIARLRDQQISARKVDRAWAEAKEWINERMSG